MKIILVPVRQQWYIEHAKAWYQIETEGQVEIALSVLALRIVDEYSEFEQQPYKGMACVTLGEDRLLHVHFTDVVGSSIEAVTVNVDEKCLCDIEWSEQPFNDGWVRSSSSLVVDNVSAYALKVYAPPVKNGNLEKTITIDNKTAGTTRQFTLVRGAENIMQLVGDSCETKQEFVLHCDSEPLNNSTDARELGFVLVGEILEA